MPVACENVSDMGGGRYQRPIAARPSSAGVCQVLDLLERVFVPWGVGDQELVGAWWNSRWGRMGRRDVRLEREPERWIVVARSGGREGSERTWTFTDERQARSMVERCLATGGEDWREITEAFHASAEALRRRSAGRPESTP